MTSEFKKEMIYLATHEMKATEERILKAYNKEQIISYIMDGKAYIRKYHGRQPRSEDLLSIGF